MPAALLSRDEAVARIAEVFRAHGYAGASLAAITAATGLGKGSLYHHFPGGKDEMAAAVLAQIDRWFEAAVFAPLHERGDIDAMFAAVDRYFAGGGRICLVGAFALDDTRDRFAAAVQDYFSRWVAALQAALSRRGVAAAAPLAETTVAGIQGALVLARALDDPAVFGRQLAGLRDRLAAALA